MSRNRMIKFVPGAETDFQALADMLARFRARVEIDCAPEDEDQRLDMIRAVAERESFGLAIRKLRRMLARWEFVPTKRNTSR